jgi:ATP adenylyltransferase
LTLLLQAGSLRERVRAATAHALACGALEPIATDHRFLEQGEVRFVVRILSGLARKEAARMQRAAGPGSGSNPFLPYDQDLYVADISDTHVCLLNKFNVMEHHLLMVTRAFEDQEAPLTLSDFEALWVCLGEMEGLAFYNAGAVAGASQPHKHLQMVALPLAPEGPAVPIEPLLAHSAGGEAPFGWVPALPFGHAFARFGQAAGRPARELARESLEHYRAMLGAFGLWTHDDEAPAPYNLLVTRKWMLLVPRGREFFHGVGVNALGFAGALLVRNEQELATLERYGPMTALARVGVARHRWR